MIESKFTPGPWEILTYGPDAAGIRIGNDIIEGAYTGGDRDCLGMQDAP